MLRDERCQLALTPRQIDVVRLVASGMTYKAAGRRLGISRHTVDEHLRDARQRTGLQTNVELIAWAACSGVAISGPTERTADGDRAAVQPRRLPSPAQSE
jgi:DNA-binding CsgD family transcriptional regulator